MPEEKFLIPTGDPNRGFVARAKATSGHAPPDASPPDVLARLDDRERRLGEIFRIVEGSPDSMRLQLEEIREIARYWRG